MWTKSACVVLAWSILFILLVAVGMKGSARPAQANHRIASSTSSTSSTSRTSSTEVTLASTLSFTAASVPPAGPAAQYVVQPGDTLSGIAARFGVRGGWPALYAANRPIIGSDPDVVRPGTVLALPGQSAPARYKVVSGDTLAGIAAALAVRGGWPALYAANRQVIGSDPDVIRPGTVLAVPHPAAPSPASSAPGPHPAPAPAPAPPATQPRPQPARTSAPAAAGLPQWLKTMLLAVGFLVGAAFVAEPLLLLHRRRRAARAAGLRMAVPGQDSGPEGQVPARARSAAACKARVVLADYDRVVVTHSESDGMVYVLRPPGEDPKAILRAARLVLPEDLYQELARQLGLPASWPIVLADYDRVVVTHTASDGMVYVLRPPGEDPKAILRAARLVLPEGPYGELADQLGIPAGWPAG
jgi:LysM repeat protein